MNTLWMGSIRTRVFLGCMSLTLVTILVGLLSGSAQVQLSSTALGIYDNAFVSMSYLRSAQSVILGVSRDLALGETNADVFIDQLQSAEDALDVARERAMTREGEEEARHLQAAVSDLQSRLRGRSVPPTRSDFRAIEQQFDMAVATYAGDGFRLRGTAESLADRTRLETYAAMAASALVAFVIAVRLSRAIVPSIRHAVKIAASIAGGQLDNRIDWRGPSETIALLEALATMQQSIAEKIARIESLLQQQASTHAAEIALQHTRFEAALDNMNLGLCMFDVGGNLLVSNRRFIEMFVPDGGDDDLDGLDGLLPQLRLDLSMTSGPEALTSRSLNRLLEDGRTIAIAQEMMACGGRVVTYEDISERQRAEARLSHMARHDALTGLPNRVVFREQFDRDTEAHRRGKLTVFCLDLDRFKTVNDTLGHGIGDELLRETAARLRRTAEEEDVVVRLGGDEFAVIRLTDAEREGSADLAGRLIDAMSLPFDIHEHRISIGVSIGIAEAESGLDTADDLLKNADLALYAAKADGRGTFRFFEREMYRRLHAKRRLELDIRTAIEERQFELFYQPLLSTRDGSVVAFEALLRWYHPERGMVSPADFIPVAEETGLIVELGLWVLDRACRDAATWPNPVKVAVNLSPLQFRSPDLVGDVAGALERHGLEPSRLELEITESLLLQDTNQTLTILHDLRELGISISMDDFGTGYSSLSYLRRFPFDKIKIDRSFISAMEASGDGLAIVTAVIGLGRLLKMSVVAEGVETQAQMDLLCIAGCEEVQGYLFSRPQPLDALVGLIDRFSVGRPTAAGGGARAGLPASPAAKASSPWQSQSVHRSPATYDPVEFERPAEIAAAKFG